MSHDLRYEYYSEVQAVDVEWLWYPYIPYGKITVLQGDPGEGKSTFMVNIAAMVTNGSLLPDGTTMAQPQKVIYQCAEDSVTDTIKPRLLAAGADCTRIAYVQDNDVALTLDDDRLEKVLIETGARLLILDPIQAFLTQGGDMRSATRMRAILSKLADIADRHQCAIVLIGHLNKSSGGKSLYRGLGSIDIAAIARSVLLIGRSNLDSDIRYMRPIKSSLAPEGMAIAFSFDGSGVTWLGSVPPESLDFETPSSKHKRHNGAIQTVRDYLKVGECPSTTFFQEMASIGISRRMIFRVKDEAGIESYKKGNVWFWRLADNDIHTTAAAWEELK